MVNAPGRSSPTLCFMQEQGTVGSDWQKPNTRTVIGRTLDRGSKMVIIQLRDSALFGKSALIPNLYSD